MSIKSKTMEFFRDIVGPWNYACRKCAQDFTGSTQFAGMVSSLKKDGYSINTLAKGRCSVCGKEARFLDSLLSLERVVAKRRPIAPEVTLFKQRAIDSLLLAVELFNRPNNRGRTEAVLILLQHAFEMLMKSMIKHKGVEITAKNPKFSISFDQCLQRCSELGLVDGPEKRSISALDAHRDQAAHHIVDMSEQLLYVVIQSAVTSFDKLLHRAFDERVADDYPTRVLPISTEPPGSLTLLIDSELTQVDKLLAHGRARQPSAALRLRSVLTFANAVLESGTRVSEEDADKALQARQAGQDWTVILPDVSTLRLTQEGEGINFKLSIGKSSDIAVRIAKEGEPIVGTIIPRIVDVRDKYPFSHNILADKLGIGRNQLTLLIKEHSIKSNPDFHHLYHFMSQKTHLYNLKCLDFLRTKIEEKVDFKALQARHYRRLS